MGKAAKCRASQANNAPAMRVWKQTVVIYDVFTVENLENADEGGYIRVNMHVG